MCDTKPISTDHSRCRTNIRYGSQHVCVTVSAHAVQDQPNRRIRRLCWRKLGELLSILWLCQRRPCFVSDHPVRRRPARRGSGSGLRGQGGAPDWTNDLDPAALIRSACLGSLADGWSEFHLSHLRTWQSGVAIIPGPEIPAGGKVHQVSLS